MPDRSDRYQLPSWPPINFDRDLWNGIFGDIADRLTAREELEASFQSLIDQGIQASLDYIQVTVAPQIADLQTSIQLAQDQIEQIIVDGVSPNSLKLGGQLPAYYATAQALTDGLSGKVSTSLTINGKALTANVTLAKADIGLDQVNNTSDADKPISNSQAEAFAKRVRVDAAQVFSAAEKGRALANLDAGIMAGHRNKISNGLLRINQRAGLMTSGFIADMFGLIQSQGGGGAVSTGSVQPFSPGLAGVIPGDTDNYLRIVLGALGALSGSVNYVGLTHKIENVRTLAGQLATCTFYMRSPLGPRTISLNMRQRAGSGGTIDGSALRFISDAKLLIGTSWARYDVLLNIPALTGATLGPGSNLDVTWMFSYQGANEGLDPTGMQSNAGEIHLARPSLVAGDARNDPDPFAERPAALEELICRRFCEKGYAYGSVAGTGGNIRLPVSFGVPKWATPVISFQNVVYGGGGSGIAAIDPRAEGFTLGFNSSSSPSSARGDFIAEANL